MSKLAEIKKQIVELEAEAARISKEEMSGAIAQVKEIMATFGLTIQHLGTAISGKGRSAAKAKSKRSGAGVVKYADPKTGKTWTGFGRVPGWIASAKNRDAFQVGKSKTEAAAAPAAKAPRAKRGAASAAAKAAGKPSTRAAKKAAPGGTGKRAAAK